MLGPHRYELPFESLLRNVFGKEQDAWMTPVPALDETGLVVTTATTNLFGHPMFKDGAVTANEREVRRYTLAKVMRDLDLAAELGVQTY